MVLGTIQAALRRIYDLPTGPSVDDYLCDAAVATSATPDAVVRGEVLVVAEGALDHVAVGLYVDADAVETLATSDDWLCGGFHAACLATEGVSHFNYFVFRAGNAEPLSQLELELQGDVDKYAAGLFGVWGGAFAERLLEGNGIGLTRSLGRDWSAHSQDLRQRLFERVRYVDAPGTEEGERYRTANGLAARFAAQLERTYVDGGNILGASRELRRFYRHGLADKVRAAHR